MTKKRMDKHDRQMAAIRKLMREGKRLQAENQRLLAEYQRAGSDDPKRVK